MKLGFNIEKKSDTNVNLCDKDGKSVFSDKLKKFSGKYSKDIKIGSGKFILEINQAKKYFHKTIIIEK